MDRAIKNVTSERIVVGSLINNPDWWIEISNIVKLNYFYMLGHKTIIYLITSLLKEGVTNIDTLEILARAERVDKATKIINDNGGLEYLETLQELAEEYTLDDIKRHANIIATCSFKREKEANAEQFVRFLHEQPDLTIGEVEIWEQKKCQELQSKYSIGHNITTIGEMFEYVWTEIEDNRGDGIVGLPSKIPLANRYFGYQNGELIVIGARAKYGKSNFAINEAHNLAVNYGIPVAIFDTEMKTRTFLARILALDSGVAIREIQDGSYLKDMDKVISVDESKQRIRQAPLIHKYHPYWDKAKVASTAKLLKLRYNIGMLIYDYIKVKEVSGNMKEHSELGNWTIFLKDLAGDLDIPILTFAQLSPHEMRLADSDKINRYASVIAYLLPKSPEQIAHDMGADLGGMDYLYVDYNRLGESMHQKEKGINLNYTRYLAKFEQAKYQPLEDFEM